jgi:hypothetical protein
MTADREQRGVAAACVAAAAAGALAEGGHNHECMTGVLLLLSRASVSAVGIRLAAQLPTAPDSCGAHWRRT